jgi:hypothetical protein
LRKVNSSQARETALFEGFTHEAVAATKVEDIKLRIGLKTDINKRTTVVCICVTLKTDGASGKHKYMQYIVHSSVSLPEFPAFFLVPGSGIIFVETLVALET